MRAGVLISVLFHGVVVLALLFVAPAPSAPPPLQEATMIVDLAEFEVSERTAAPAPVPETLDPRPAPPAPAPAPPEPARPAPAPPAPAPPAPAPLEPAPAPPPPAPKPAALKKPPPPAKKHALKKPRPQDGAKTRKTDRGKESKPDPFVSLLRNVEKIRKKRAAAPASTASRPSPSDEPSQGPAAPSALKATLSERDFIRKQIEDKWSFDAGARGVRDMVIPVRVRLSRDGRVRSAAIADRARYENDPAYRSVSEAARRAVFLAQPLKFPADKYDTFKEIVLTFRPGDLVR